MKKHVSLSFLTAILFFGFNVRAAMDCSTIYGEYLSYSKAAGEGAESEQYLQLNADGKFVWAPSDYLVNGTFEFEKVEKGVEFVQGRMNSECKFSYKADRGTASGNGYYNSVNDILIWNGIWFKRSKP